MPDKNTSSFNVDQIRKDFPVLARELRPGVPLTYLDSAATSQKPTQVLEAMNAYYREMNANIHRGVHSLAEEATHAYEDARSRIATFIGAPSEEEIIFTRNTTEAINLVAFSWGRTFLQAGDTILLTEMEHHSNLVPWQLLASELDLTLEFIPVTDEGLLDLAIFHDQLKREPKLLGITHMSNVLGTVNPLQEILKDAKAAGAVTLVDGAQSVPHFPVNLKDLDVDFYAFSAHKMCGPTGTGVLFGRKELLEKMPPFLGGGEMIKRVELHSFKANDLPHKFEAGTPAIAEVIGFGAAVDYLNELGMEQVELHEKSLTGYAIEQLSQINEIQILGPDIEQRGGVVSFYVDGIHAHDVAQILDSEGVAVRAGHHCAQPLHSKFGLPATARASLYLYNTKQEIDLMVKGIHKTLKVFA